MAFTEIVQRLEKVKSDRVALVQERAVHHEFEWPFWRRFASLLSVDHSASDLCHKVHESQYACSGRERYVNSVFEGAQTQAERPVDMVLFTSTGFEKGMTQALWEFVIFDCQRLEIL